MEPFNFGKNRIIAGRYRVIEQLGAGWEGEVYHVAEEHTGISRAAKFFYPKRNIRNRAAIGYAKLLHQLSTCPITVNYHTQETFTYKHQSITGIILEFVEGELLSSFVHRQQKHKLGIYRSLQLLHALVVGLESMHHLSAYHGDLHPENIIVKRYGLGFDLKILDMHLSNKGLKRDKIADDIVDAIKVFYDVLGGARYYKTHPPEIKDICCGLKHSLILKKFKNMSMFRNYLENIVWQSNRHE